MAKKPNAIQDPGNAKFVEVEEKTYDVATAYALLSNGTVPPVIRGDDLDTL